MIIRSDGARTLEGSCIPDFEAGRDHVRVDEHDPANNVEARSLGTLSLKQDQGNKRMRTASFG